MLRFENFNRYVYVIHTVYITKCSSLSCVQNLAQNKLNFNFCLHWIRNSSVGIETAYVLDDQGGAGFQVPLGKKFLLLHIVHTGSGVHPSSYKMSTGGLFPGGKAAGA
jgi:hypothetical protein